MLVRKSTLTVERPISNTQQGAFQDFDCKCILTGDVFMVAPPEDAKEFSNIRAAKRRRSGHLQEDDIMSVAKVVRLNGYL